MTTSTGEPTRDWAGLTIPTAGTYLLDQAHKRVGFVARHMMVSKVRGEFTEVEAAVTIDEDPLKSSVTATIQAASIASGQGDRDVHLRSADFLDVEQFPTLEFHSTGVKSHSGNEFVLTGELTIKVSPGPWILRSSSRVPDAARSGRTSSGSPRRPRSTARTSA